MRRRTVLRSLGMGLAGGSPTISLEALRQGLGQTLDADHDGWRTVVVEYGHAYYTTPPARLGEQLAADLALLQQMIDAETGVRRFRLMATASQLATLLAMALAATGQRHVAARWRSSAQLAAARSQHTDAVVFVGTWAVVNGCYHHQSLAPLIERAEKTIALTGDRVDATVAGLHAGHAQALALAGRPHEAELALRRVAQATERMPADILADASSVFGWPEHRLRHTESLVYTHTGRFAAAEAAQDRAISLYPPSQSRLRAQVLLHRATGMVKAGDVSTGVRYAVDVLDQLPRALHTANLHEVARQVVANVVDAKGHRADIADLNERVASGPAV